MNEANSGCVTTSHQPSAYFSCKGCWLAEVCKRHAVPDTDLKWLRLNTATRHPQRGAAIYRSGDRFHSVFVVKCGTCKSLAISSRGQEKIVAFHLPGEMFGLLGITNGDYPYDAIAVEDSEICAIRYADLAAICGKNLEWQRGLFRIMSYAIASHEELMDQLGSLSAEAKIILWLDNLSDRYAHSGCAADELPLPMTRVEIGNYLGLAHETVTRIFGRLQKANLVQLTECGIQLKDRAKLLKRATADTSDCEKRTSTMT